MFSATRTDSGTYQLAVDPRVDGQDRSRRVNVVGEWRLNDRPRGQRAKGRREVETTLDGNPSLVSAARRASLNTSTANVRAHVRRADELPESSEETRTRGMYAVIRKFPVVYDARRAARPCGFHGSAPHEGPSRPGNVTDGPNYS